MPELDWPPAVICLARDSGREVEALHGVVLCPEPGIELLVAEDRRGSALDELIRRYACYLRGGNSSDWQVARTSEGAPYLISRAVDPVPSLSIARAGGFVVVALALAVRVGVDVETMARIAANLRVGDRWLSAVEQAQCTAAADPVAALACRWVLKEAIGKALRYGLPRAPEEWTITVSDRITAWGPPPLRLALLAWRGLLIGMSCDGELPCAGTGRT